MEALRAIRKGAGRRSSRAAGAAPGVSVGLPRRPADVPRLPGGIGPRRRPVAAGSAASRGSARRLRPRRDGVLPHLSPAHAEPVEIDLCGGHCEALRARLERSAFRRLEAAAPGGGREREKDFCSTKRFMIGRAGRCSRFERRGKFLRIPPFLLTGGPKISSARRPSPSIGADSACPAIASGTEKRASRSVPGRRPPGSGAYLGAAASAVRPAARPARP